MRTKLLLLMGTILFVACSPKPKSQKTEDQSDTTRFQVAVGDEADVEPPQLPFKITAALEGQKPSDKFPFHENGGDWTFFECTATEDAKVKFKVGVLSEDSSGDAPVAWGKAMLIVDDQMAGGEFLSLFHKSFPGKIPSASDQKYDPKPLKINTAILGDGLQREPGGGFSGDAGEWTATKWFPEFDGRSGEIYFNYNLVERKGEFSEKEAEYAESLLALFAAALRDGPRPARTPINDPNLTLVCPSIGPARKLASEQAGHYTFSPSGRFAVYQVGTTVCALSMEESDSEPFDVIKLDHSPWDVRVLSDDLDFVIQEGIPENPAFRSSSDPMRFWWVDGNNKERKLLRGPEKDLNLAESPVSPDLRFIGFERYEGKPGSHERCKVVFIFDRNEGTEVQVRMDGEDLSLVGWKAHDAGVRAILVTNRWQFDGDKSELYLSDPSKGTLEQQKDADARYELDNIVSPDDKHRVRIGDDNLLVTNVASGEKRTFTFHEDDKEFVGEECVEWASPQYLKFNGQKLSLIDVTSMKMCFPHHADEIEAGSHSYKFSPDLHWVLFNGEDAEGEALFLAPIKMPKQEQ